MNKDGEAIGRLPSGNALCPIVEGIDSSSFTALDKPPHEFSFTPKQWADQALVLTKKLNPKFVLPMDRMVEPFMLSKTGWTLEASQRWTTENYLLLCELAPTVPWAPVIQGWEPSDYERHADQYEQKGVKLETLSRVALGSMCKRQHMGVAVEIVRRMTDRRLKLHVLGFKIDGLCNLARARLLSNGSRPGAVSGDSQGGSLHARKNKILIPGHDKPGPGRKGHQTCATCPDWYILWRLKVLSRLWEAERQPESFQTHLPGF